LAAINNSATGKQSAVPPPAGTQRIAELQHVSDFVDSYRIHGLSTTP